MSHRWIETHPASSQQVRSSGLSSSSRRLGVGPSALRREKMEWSKHNWQRQGWTRAAPSPFSPPHSSTLLHSFRSPLSEKPPQPAQCRDSSMETLSDSLSCVCCGRFCFAGVVLLQHSQKLTLLKALKFILYAPAVFYFYSRFQKWPHFSWGGAAEASSVRSHQRWNASSRSVRRGSRQAHLALQGFLCWLFGSVCAGCCLLALNSCTLKRMRHGKEVGVSRCSQIS